MKEIDWKACYDKTHSLTPTGYALSPPEFKSLDTVEPV